MTATATIKEILEQIKKESFVEGYTATDSEAMGMLISHYFKWDGIQILESSMYALEDANFHSECQAVSDMLDKIKKQK